MFSSILVGTRFFIKIDSILLSLNIFIYAIQKYLKDQLPIK